VLLPIAPGLTAAQNPASFLVLGALLEAALCHVPIDFGAPQLRARTHDVDGRFLAALERKG